MIMVREDEERHFDQIERGVLGLVSQTMGKSSL